MGYRLRASRWLVAAGLLVACASFFGPSGYPVAVEIVAEPVAGPTLAPPIVAVEPGQIVVELEEGFSDPGYAIRAEARSEAASSSSVSDGVLVEVETRRLDGTFPAVPWTRRYRLTVGSVPRATYTLRLRWQDDFKPPAFRSRILIDTVITVP